MLVMSPPAHNNILREVLAQSWAPRIAVPPVKRNTTRNLTRWRFWGGVAYALFWGQLVHALFWGQVTHAQLLQQPHVCLPGSRMEEACRLPHGYN